jgi:hypothetical protein
MQCTKCGAELQPGATVCPACEARVVLDRKTVAEPRKRVAASAPVVAKPLTPQPAEAQVTPVGKVLQLGRKAWSLPVLIAAVVVVVAITVWGVFSVFGGAAAASPEAAATRMLQAYADYDAKAFFTYVTHASLSTTDEAAFTRQLADLNTTNKGLPVYKEVKVTKVTIDPKDPNSATVQLTELILDTNTGTYSPRNETLSVVKQGGKWLVRLF